MNDFYNEYKKQSNVWSVLRVILLVLFSIAVFRLMWNSEKSGGRATPVGTASSCSNSANGAAQSGGQNVSSDAAGNCGGNGQNGHPGEYDQPVAMEVTAEPPAEDNEKEVQPVKTVPELLADVDQAIGQGEYGDAESLMSEVLEHVNKQALSSASLWMKAAEIELALDQADEARSRFERAMSIIERENGPDDIGLLPAMTGIIASLDEQGDLERSRIILSRYLAVASAVKKALPVVSSTTDEKKFGELFKAAEQKVAGAAQASANDAADDGSTEMTMCTALLQTLQDVRENSGIRSPVRAMLLLKLAEVNDNGAETADDGCVIETSDLLSALSILEQHYGPFDPRLSVVLRRLIADVDDSGKYQLGDFFKWRLSLLGQANKVGRLEGPYVTGESVLPE